MSSETLKNGLTTDQAQKARDILKKASIKKIAKLIGTSDTKIYSILSGESPDIELLNSALQEAHKLNEKKKQLIANLPLHG